MPISGNGARPSPEQGLPSKNEHVLRNYIATVNLHHRLNREPLRDGQKVRIHFLYLADAYWSSWETFYHACLADSRVETTIIFLERQAGELPGFPDPEKARAFLETNSIPYIPYAQYDPYVERPHILVYQSPYNDVYLHFPKLKANFIKQAGIRPVYISYGIEYDQAPEGGDVPAASLNVLHYRQYVQLFAWKQFVMHEDIREGFFRHCLAGGAQVVAMGHPKFDGYMRPRQKAFPGDFTAKAGSRPILVWQVHHHVRRDDRSGSDRSHSLPFSETRAIAEWLHLQSGIFTILTLHPSFATDVVRNGRTGAEDIATFKKLVTNSPNMTLYEGPYQPLLAQADAFITEPSSLMLEMAFLGKPVLFLHDLDVNFKPFAGDIVDSFYHGRGLADLKNFLHILSGTVPDTLAATRKRVHGKHFSNCDGEVGGRIKTYLLESLLQEGPSHPFPGERI